MTELRDLVADALQKEGDAPWSEYATNDQLHAMQREHYLEAADAALWVVSQTLHDSVDEGEHCCGCRVRDAAGHGPVKA